MRSLKISAIKKLDLMLKNYAKEIPLSNTYKLLIRSIVENISKFLNNGVMVYLKN